MSAEEEKGKMKVRGIMSRPIITEDEACELAAKKRIKRLPVVENGVPIGIVSVRNILTRKPEYVRRFYPRMRILASGWTLDRLERYFSECEIFLARKDAKRYTGKPQVLFCEGVHGNHGANTLIGGGL